MLGHIGLILALNLFCAFADRIQICEHSTATLACRAGQKLSISAANYGRTQYNPCPHPARSNLNCLSSPSVLNKVRTTCSGLSTCTLTASNSVYGDTCVGTFKYLDVTYSCKETRHVTACEHSRAQLQCPAGQTIQVTNVNYGRTDRTTCPHSSIKTTNCHSGPAATNIVKNACDGHNSCSVLATNGNMGGDPCVGTYKYLRVSYDCV